MIYVLFSGGVDSLACLSWAQQTFGRFGVTAIYFDVGQAYLGKELEAASRIAKEMGAHLMVRDEFRGVLEENPLTAEIPLRNAFLILAVAAIPSARGVVFGMLKGECPADKNPAFVRRMRKLVDSQRRDFQIYTPLAHWDKAAVVYALNATEKQALQMTVGCHSGRPGCCGACWACINRWIAFGTAGVPDPDDYLESPAENLMLRMASARSIKTLTGLPFIARRRWGIQAFRLLEVHCREKYRRSFLSHVIDMRRRVVETDLRRKF